MCVCVSVRPCVCVSVPACACFSCVKTLPWMCCLYECFETGLCAAQMRLGVSEM